MSCWGKHSPSWFSGTGQHEGLDGKTEDICEQLDQTFEQHPILKGSLALSSQYLVVEAVGQRVFTEVCRDLVVTL